VVFNCASRPEAHAHQDPGRLHWEPVITVEQYRVEANEIMQK